jgi:hypothetical protein
LKGGRDGENSANKKGLTFSLSCCIRSGPLSTLRRQNTTRFLSSDEQQASRQGEMKGRGKGRRGANPGEADNGKCGQDFEQSQSNHGWPVLLCARFGHSLWIFGKIQYQVQIRSLVSQLPRHDDTHHVPSGVTTAPDLSSPVRAERPDRSPRCRWIGPYPHSLHLVLLVLLTVPCPLLFIACT